MEDGGAFRSLDVQVMIGRGVPRSIHPHRSRRRDRRLVDGRDRDRDRRSPVADRQSVDVVKPYLGVASFVLRVT